MIFTVQKLLNILKQTLYVFNSFRKTCSDNVCCLQIIDYKIIIKKEYIFKSIKIKKYIFKSNTFFQYLKI